MYDRKRRYDSDGRRHGDGAGGDVRLAKESRVTDVTGSHGDGTAPSVPAWPMMQSSLYHGEETVHHNADGR